MKLDGRLVEAAAEATGPDSWNLSAAGRVVLRCNARASIFHYLENRSLPERMRDAAETHRAAAERDRKGGFVSVEATRWSAPDLNEYADKWEFEDRAKTEQDELAQELGVELLRSFVEVPIRPLADDAIIAARALIAKFDIKRRDES